MRRPQKIERGKSGKRTVEIERGLVYKHFLDLLNKTYLNSKENIISSLIKTLFRCSLPKAMSISRSEILRRKKKAAAAETEVEKLPSVKVLESVS